MKKIILVLTLLTLLVSNVNALGISPAGTSVEFVQGSEKDFSFRVLNTNNEDMVVNLSYRTDADVEVVFDSETLELSSEDDYKRFNLLLILKDDVAVGNNFVDVIVSKSVVETGMVSVVPSVVSRINIFKPNHGLHASALLRATRTNPELPVRLTTSVLNQGTLVIGSAFVELSFYDNNNLVGSKKSDFFSIPVGSENKVDLEFELGKGAYFVNGSLFYDNKELPLQKHFNVGEKDVVVSTIVVNNFVPNSIVGLDVVLDSLWNEPINSVFINAQIVGDDILYEYDSIMKSLNTYGSEDFELFIDTSNFGFGNYTLAFNIFLDDASQTKTFDFVYSEDSLIVGSFEEEVVEKNYLFLTLLILFLLVLFLFYVYKLR